MTVTSAYAAKLTVRAQSIQSAEGQVMVAVCQKSFDQAGCPYGARRAARPGSIAFTFPNIPAGQYAIVVYHDINGNGRMDTFPPGLPTEPYGFSNDIGRKAPPRFARALVSVGKGASTVRINVRRLFE